MAMERFELDLTPHPPDEEHVLTLSELLSHTIRDYHQEHPELRMQEVQDAVRRVEGELLRKSGGSNELAPETRVRSTCSWRYMGVTAVLILLCAFAMTAALELIRRP